ncbi:MAG TPA: flagellar basal body L-ring protein FlgH [Bdellovibrionota bacterium]|nr:flagellar basal body L-ring protein FlgH [Bdellovibrionota bacterium]
MNSTHAFKLTLAVAVLVWTSGCAQLMGNLRRDMDDHGPYQEPTVGGTFSERNLLADYEFEDPASRQDDEGEYRTVGHSERGPASMRTGNDGQPGSWIPPQSTAGPVGPAYTDNPNLPPETKRLYQDGVRARKADFEDSAPNEGSLWASTGQTNYFFTKNKVKAVGDLVTVVLKDRVIKDMGAEVKKTLTQEEADAAVLETEEKRRMEALKGGRGPAGQAAAAQAQAQAQGQERTGEEPPAIPPATFADVDVTGALGIKDGEQMMAEILERYPNGNYKIRATKRVPYKNQTRMVTLVAIARSTDVNEAETIDSGNLYEYRVKAFR